MKTQEELMAEISLLEDLIALKDVFINSIIDEWSKEIKAHKITIATYEAERFCEKTGSEEALDFYFKNQTIIHNYTKNGISVEEVKAKMGIKEKPYKEWLEDKFGGIDDNQD